MSIFQQQAFLMSAQNQTINSFNADQYSTYLTSLQNQINTLTSNLQTSSKVDELNSLIKILFTVIGTMYSAGFLSEEACQEFFSSKNKQIDPKTFKLDLSLTPGVLDLRPYILPELLPDPLYNQNGEFIPPTFTPDYTTPPFDAANIPIVKL